MSAVHFQQKGPELLCPQDPTAGLSLCTADARTENGKGSVGWLLGESGGEHGYGMERERERARARERERERC